MRVDLGPAGDDTVQTTLQFLGVEEFEAKIGALPADVGITAERGERHYARFTVAGDGVRIRFRAHEEIRSGHLSRYRRGARPEEHHFLGAVDRRLYTTVPPPWREDFHGRV